MGTEQFSLKWNDHTQHLVGVFEALLQSESLVDVTISCEGRSLRAHKLVLSACSPYFKTLFQEHADSHPIVILKDVKFAELRSIIQFMYKGEVEVDQHDIASLISTAKSLEIRGLAGPRSTASNLHFPTAEAREPGSRHDQPDGGLDRKRPRSELDAAGFGGEAAAPPPVDAAGTADAAANNGDDTTVIKHPKIESTDSTDENSGDGMESGTLSGTTYLCPACGLSFHAKQQLQLHHANVHARTPDGVERQTVVRAGRPPSPAAARRTSPGEPPLAPLVAAHSHSWPPHELHEARDGRDVRDRLPWDRVGLRRSEHGLRLPLMLGPRAELHSPFLPPMISVRDMGNGRGLLPGMSQMLQRHLTPPASAGGALIDYRPLDLTSVGDPGAGSSPPAASPVGDRSAPTTPTPSDDNNPVTCKYCTRVFDSIGSLMDHMTVHQGDRPFLCEWCNKAFKFRHHLKDHCRIHTGERPFECQICGKNFARSSILKTHTKIHRQDGRRFEIAPGPFPSPIVPSLAELPVPPAVEDGAPGQQGQPVGQ